MARIAGQNRREVTPFERAVADVAKEAGLSPAMLHKEATTAKLRQSASRVLAAETYTPTPLLTLSDLMNDDSVDVVEGFLAQGTMNMILGPSNVGKTFVAVDLVGSLIHGMPWFGRKVESTPVVYIQAEGSGRKFAERVKAWELANNPDEPVRAEFFLGILRQANLQSDVSLEEIGNAVETLKEQANSDHCVVVVDTYAATAGVEDENDAAAVAGTLRRLRDAVDGATVVFLHHPNKASERSGGRLDARGSGAMRGALDTVLVVMEDSEITEARADGSRYLRLTTDPAMGGKVREGKPLDVRAVTLTDCGNSAVLTQTDGPVYSASTNKLLKLIAETPDLNPERFTKGDINEAVGKDRTANSGQARWISAAVADGAIHEIGTERSAKVYAVK
jgi:KaiC/GvpD/RAD55 family RecA-like ATPase